MKRLFKNILIGMLVAVPLAIGANFVDLASQVTGILPQANGGTGATSYNAYNPAAVAITGGSISGLSFLSYPTTISGVAGSFSGNGTYGLQIQPLAGSLCDFRIVNPTNTVERLCIQGATLAITGNVIATQFNGSGAGLTGTAAGLSIGGNAGTATTATNLSGGTSAPTTENASTSYSLNGKLLNTAASPSLGGGGTCGTGATVSGSTSSFTVYTGTGSSNTQCNINMPAGAASGWICFAQPPLPSANTATIFQSLTANTADVVNITVSTGALTPWPSGATFHVGCISTY